MAGTAQLRGIHMRRAKLLGLDAPTKLDLRGLYRTGSDEMSTESFENQRVWQSLPVAEQIRIYESLAEARQRLNVPIETTAVTSGPDNRNTLEPPADNASIQRPNRERSGPNWTSTRLRKWLATEKPGI